MPARLLRPVFLLILGLLTPTAGLLSPAPAVADTVLFADPRGDAVARFDMTRVVVANSRRRLAVTVRVPDLSRRGTQIVGIGAQTIRTGSTYMLYTVRRPNGTQRTWIRAFASDGDELLPACRPAARWDLRRGLVRVRLVRGCLDPGTIRASAFIGAGNGSAGDPSDWTKQVLVEAG